MRLLHSNFLPSLAATTFVSGVVSAAQASDSSVSSFCGVKPKSIVDSQAIQGREYIGSPASANRLHPKFWHEPRSSALHIDTGNTRTVDYPGPLGRNVTVKTTTVPFAQFFWDASGGAYAAWGGICNGSTSDVELALTILNPDTMEIEGVWQPPAPYANADINLTYMQVLMDKDQIVISTKEGQIFILQRCGNSFDLVRTIDLKPTAVLKGFPLLNSIMDTAGNVWFSTGGLNAAGVAPGNLTVVGYIEPDDTVHSIEMADLAIENGPSLTNTTLFLSVGPQGSNDHENAVGFTMRFEPSPSGVKTVYNATYDAGSRRKYPGSFARGSGTTPALLGNDFLALNDNADGQTNLVILPQNATGTDVKPVCKIPIFQPNASKTDNAAIVHWDGENYGVVMQNMYDAVPFSLHDNSTNGVWNNMTQQVSGISKYFVAGDGSGCHLEWTNPTRMSADPILSTATGLLYGYEQSEELANEGQYVWYASAIDWKTGKTVWKVRAGAGGIFNNFYRTTFLGPDGTLYQPVQGGVVMVKDLA